MAAFAIIGATGRTGRQILQILAQNSANTVKVYVRSQKKLESLFPNIVEQKHVQIFVGSIDDADLLARCISGATMIFATVAPQSNDPRSHIAFNTAQSIVAAISRNRSSDLAAEVPHIIALSSATINPMFNKFTPRPVHFLLTTSLCNKYADLSAMESFLRSHQDWLHVTFVQPGGLVEDKPKGFKLSLESTKSFLSIADLAAGMIEIGLGRKTYDWESVSVVPTRKNVPFNRRVPLEFAKGYCWRIAPTICRKLQ